MEMYHKIKAKYPDALLLFRVGEAYECYFEDAKNVSKALGVVLTHKDENTALAGFPYGSIDIMLPKLIRAGFRVALCDELPAPTVPHTTKSSSQLSFF